MAGYSGTPLAKKLGIGPEMRVAAIDAPADYAAIVAPVPDGAVIASRVSASTDVVHLFTTSKEQLARHLGLLRTMIRPDAVVWVSWPKKASKVFSDVTEDAIRAIALPLGFVDVKVCAVTDVWSGLKLVVRKELRRQDAHSGSGRLQRQARERR